MKTNKHTQLGMIKNEQTKRGKEENKQKTKLAREIINEARS